MPTRRYATVGIIVLAGIVAAVLAHLTAWSLGMLALANPAVPGSSELCLSNAVGVAVAGGAAYALRRIPATSTLCDEVVEELLRVSWPRREEVVRATWVVIGTVILCSVYLGFLDAFWLWLTDALLGINQDVLAAIGPPAR